MILQKYAERIGQELRDELGMVAMGEKSVLVLHERSVGVCLKYLGWLKQFVTDTEVGDIELFKVVKPQFESLLIFHQEMLDIEARCFGDGFYEAEIERLNWFYKCNAAFCLYVRIGSTHLDDKYFVRGVYDLKLGPDLSVMDGDDSFRTSHSLKLAQYYATEMLISHLQHKIRRLQNGEEEPQGGFEGLEWTQTKSGLVELAYALSLTNAFNHGKANLHSIVRFLEKAFQTELGNFYDTFKSIRQRDKRTIYMDQLKKALTDRMDDLLG